MYHLWKNWENSHRKHILWLIWGTPIEKDWLPLPYSLHLGQLYPGASLIPTGTRPWSFPVILNYHIQWVLLGFYYPSSLVHCTLLTRLSFLKFSVFYILWHCDVSCSVLSFVFPSHSLKVDISLVSNLYLFFSFLYKPLSKTVNSATVSMLIISSSRFPKL